MVMEGRLSGGEMPHTPDLIKPRTARRDLRGTGAASWSPEGKAGQVRDCYLQGVGALAAFR